MKMLIISFFLVLSCPAIAFGPYAPGPPTFYNSPFYNMQKTLDEMNERQRCMAQNRNRQQNYMNCLQQCKRTNTNPNYCICPAPVNMICF